MDLNKNFQEEPKIFGMTHGEIIATANVLSQQKDKNKPTKSGSYQDFLKTLHIGKTSLSKQETYGKIKE